ncbi:hypothetical protein [Streptomyces prunicolor]|uniref:hypothetical protein n=1 Tax=Streptomyces prunicolor TaxID=67348 RepID=UPI000377B170|nr:hypothetical protein [Streptomyces prunicolor]
MPHLYSCPVCRADSRPYALEVAAERHGQQHRDEQHGGDHPYGEIIKPVPYQLDLAQARILVVVIAVIVIALIIKAT